MGEVAHAASNPYPREVLDEDDDGTMPASLDALGEAVIGHKIVEVRHGSFKSPKAWRPQTGLALLLDNGLTEAFKELER